MEQKLKRIYTCGGDLEEGISYKLKNESDCKGRYKCYKECESDKRITCQTC